MKVFSHCVAKSPRVVVPPSQFDRIFNPPVRSIFRSLAPLKFPICCSPCPESDLISSLLENPLKNGRFGPA